MSSVRCFYTTNFKVSSIGLPVILLLLELNNYLVGAVALLDCLSGISSVFSITICGKCCSHNFRVGSTNVRQVNSLTAFLQL